LLAQDLGMALALGGFHEWMMSSVSAGKGERMGEGEG